MLLKEKCLYQTHLLKFHFSLKKYAVAICCFFVLPSLVIVKSGVLNSFLELAQQFLLG